MNHESRSTLGQSRANCGMGGMTSIYIFVIQSALSEIVPGLPLTECQATKSVPQYTYYTTPLPKSRFLSPAKLYRLPSSLDEDGRVELAVLQSYEEARRARLAGFAASTSSSSSSSPLVVPLRLPLPLPVPLLGEPAGRPLPRALLAGCWSIAM